MASKAKTSAKQGTKRNPWRPTKYDPKFCQELIDFFDVSPYTERERKTQDRKTGREYIDYVDHPVDLPTFERFAYKIGVNGDTLVEWAGRYPQDHPKAGQLRHPDFSAAYTHAKQLQKDILITNGLQGLYPPGFAIFVAINATDMRQKSEQDVNLHTPQPLLAGAAALLPKSVTKSDAV